MHLLINFLHIQNLCLEESNNLQVKFIFGKYSETRKYCLDCKNNDEQLQHLRVFASGFLAKIYVSNKFPDLKGKKFDEICNELQDDIIRRFCQNKDYEFFEDEILIKRLSRFFDQKLNDYSKICKKFVNDKIVYFIVNEIYGSSNNDNNNDNDKLSEKKTIKKIFSKLESKVYLIYQY